MTETSNVDQVSYNEAEKNKLHQIDINIGAAKSLLHHASEYRDAYNLTAYTFTNQKVQRLRDWHQTLLAALGGLIAIIAIDNNTSSSFKTFWFYLAGGVFLIGGCVAYLARLKVENYILNEGKNIQDDYRDVVIPAQRIVDATIDTEEANAFINAIASSNWQWKAGRERVGKWVTDADKVVAVLFLLGVFYIVLGLNL